MKVTCTCVDDGRCQHCDELVPHAQLHATVYEPRPGERELYWCIHCGGDGKVLLGCAACRAAGTRWAEATT